MLGYLRPVDLQFPPAHEKDPHLWRAAEVNPLRPIDASGPKATLEGFVETMDETYRGMADLLKSYAVSNRFYLSAEERKRQIELLTSGTKAVQFLDTSGISPVLRDTIAVERLIQLKEILDRIELPAFDDIPDREAMARSSTKNGGCRTRRLTSF